MSVPVGPPGTPEWWLNRLIQRLMSKQVRYDYLEAYVTGNHPLPDGDERYVSALAAMQRKARTNYVGLVTRTPVERMTVRGFRFGGSDETSKPEADKDARQIWSANNMDFQAPILFMTAASLGDDYIMVSPPEPDAGPWANKFPIITFEDPRTCITEQDPSNPQHTRAGLRMWQDDVLQKIVVMLYLPEAVYQYVGPSVYDCRDLDTPGLTKKLLSGPQGGGLELVDAMPNPLGLVPITRAAWIPSGKQASFAEAEDVLDIQDRINATILDRMVISRSQAYKQRWAKGIKLPKTRSGQSKPPFDPGSDMLWVTDNPDAEFGEFKEADIKQILEAVRDDVGDMAAITKTPAHYLMNRMANVSGDTLTQAEAGLVSKTKQRMIAMGWALERTMRLCFAYMNDSRAAETDVEVIWADPELHSRSELADAFGKETAGGIPVVVAAERLGLQPDQIAFVAAEAEKQAALEEQHRSEDMAMQQASLQAKQNTPSGKVE